MELPIKSIALLLSLLSVAISSSAQSARDLRFNGHTLGETAETFLSTATMLEPKAMTKEYCKALLDDRRTMEKYEAA